MEDVETTETKTSIDYGLDPIEMSCTPGRDEDGDLPENWTCNPSYVNITEPSESPCVFAFKINPE